MTKKKQVEEQPTFEASIGKLESIIALMEQDNTSLEDSLKLFEEGISLTGLVQKALSEAEQKVSKLVEADNVLTTQDFIVQDS